MRTTLKILFLIYVFSGLGFIAYSQENKESFTIKNVDESASYEAIYQTFKKYKLPRPSINKSTHSGLSGYVNYNNVLFKNRFKYGISFEEGALTIFITEKQYLTEEGWAENLLPISKKRIEKLLGPIEKDLRELLADKPYVAGTIAGEEAGDDRIGVSDNLAFMATGDTTLDVIALVKGTEIIAFDLSDDKKRVKEFVYMAAPDSTPFVVSFDDKGKPAYVSFSGYYMDIYNLSENRMNIGLYDINHTYLGSETIDLPPNNTTPVLDNQSGKGGPNGFSMIFPDQESSLDNLDADDITEVLEDVLYVVDGISCLALMPSGLGAVVPCASFAVKSMKKFLPEESFSYKQLSNVEQCLSFISFKNPLKTVEKVGNAVGKIKDFIDLYKTFFPKVEYDITVIGKSKIKLGSFEEESEKIILHARSTLDKDIKYHASSDVLQVYEIDNTHPDYREGFLNISVQAVSNTKFEFESVVFYQPVDLENYPTYTKKLTIESPNYYYLPSCKTLLEDGVIDDDQYDECLDQSDDCFEMIDDRGDVVFANDPEVLSAIINEHILSASPFTDPDAKLKSEKLNMVRKLWKPDGSPYPADELGELREYVKKAPCAASWYGFGDRKDLITLGNEGLSKLKPLDEKIETLENNVTQENWEGNKKKIEDIEVKMDTIKAQYARKMDEIASKRTISWSVTVSDTNNFAKPAGTVEVYGVTWTGNQPRILYEMPFTPIRKKKKVTYFEGYSKEFWLDISFVGIAFLDGSDKPLRHGFTKGLDRLELEKGLIDSYMRFNDFTKEITKVDLYQTKSKATQIK